MLGPRNRVASPTIGQQHPVVVDYINFAYWMSSTRIFFKLPSHGIASLTMSGSTKRSRSDQAMTPPIATPIRAP
jgi:hypothetical protein